MGFSRQEHWSGLSFPSPGDLPNPGIKPGLPHCRQSLYPLSHQGRPCLKLIWDWQDSANSLYKYQICSLAFLVSVLGGTPVASVCLWTFWNKVVFCSHFKVLREITNNKGHVWKQFGLGEGCLEACTVLFSLFWMGSPTYPLFCITVPINLTSRKTIGL